nr:esterase [Gordonia sp. NB41Y]
MARFRRACTRAVIAVAAAAATILAVPATSARADVVSVQEVSPTETVVLVHSPSMNRVIRNQVLHLPGKPVAPVFYMLPGAGGAEDGVSWYHHGGVRPFFAGKRVNVVLPIGGRFSMFTDWQHDDPVLGRNKWQTYINHELPAAIAKVFRTTGANAISGVSMSAGPAVDLATQAPQRYRAVAAYSGCPTTGFPLGVLTNTMVVARGGGNVLNMWGPPGAPAWAAHDPIVNANRLRGKAIYLGSATGVPGPVDRLGPLELPGALIGGLPVESVASGCNAALSARLASLGIAHHLDIRPLGSHSWGLFAAELRASWPMIARAIGA